MSDRKTEPRKRFIEGEGWIVEEVPINTPAAPGQVAVVGTADQPAAPVKIVAVDVPLSIAQEVIAANGMIAVPWSFLTEEQVEELKKSETGQENTKAGASTDPQIVDDITAMKADQAIARVKLANTFEELNALMAKEKRATVVTAAEARAEELKEASQA